jgi:hypothetical protein
MIALYIMGMAALIASSYAALKTSQSDPGQQIRPGTAAYFLFAFFGGLGGSISIFALLVSGFLFLVWWAPIVALLVGMIFCGIIYRTIRNGPLVVFVGFPVGIVLGVVSLISV